jgi:hypothetical protein
MLILNSVLPLRSYATLLFELFLDPLHTKTRIFFRVDNYVDDLFSIVKWGKRSEIKYISEGTKKKMEKRLLNISF